MNKAQDFLEKEFSSKERKFVKEGRKQEEEWYRTVKLPEHYSFNNFLDSDGRIIKSDEVEPIEVDYEKILFFNFIGWKNNTQSNQLPLFSSMFTTAKETYQVYNKKGLNILYKFEDLDMKKADHSSPSRFDAIIGRGDALKRRVLDSYKKPDRCLLLTLQALWEKNIPGIVYDNTYLEKTPPPFLTSFFIEHFNQIERKNFLIYPATVNHDGDKNQRGFAKLVSPDSVGDHIIVFCGPIRDAGYAKETSKILKRKGIEHVFLGLVPHHVLRCLYMMSRGVILYSKLDYGPRAIYEGIWAGLPYITHKDVLMPERFKQFGSFCNDKEPDVLNAKIKELTKFENHANIHEFCKKNLTLFKNYVKIVNDINNEYKKL